MTEERASVQRLLRLLATTGAALTLVVIVSSAYLRLAQAGLSCSDWPACYGRVSIHDAASTPERAARFVHRLAASAVGAALLGLLLVAATQRPWLKRQSAIALAALVVAALLAALGARVSGAAPAAPIPAVTLANLGGGFTLLALLAWLRLTTLQPQPAIANPRVWCKLVAALALVLVIAQIALGAMVNARFAGLACPGLPACGAIWPDGALFASVDPFVELSVGPDGAIDRPPMLAALHWAHRVGALVVVGLGAVLALRLRRGSERRRRLGNALAALLVAQVMLGAAAVRWSLPLPVVLTHNLVAALLLVAMVTINWDIHASDRAA
jgi:cytochrome c oxidase assembly protein subunit 15